MAATARSVLGLLLMFSFTAVSEEFKAVNLEDILNVEVTTATKKAQKLESAPGSLTVITRKQMQDSNARTLRDVLNVFVPSLDVVPAYFRYGDRVSEGVYSRGMLSDFASQVLFLLNGQGKFNDATFSSAYPAIEFTLENVERVEVSRSPIPIYGGSAITIINIITREQFIKSGAEFFYDVGVMEDVNWTNRPVSSRRMSGNFGSMMTDYWHVAGSVQTYSDAGQEHGEPAANGAFTGDQSSIRDGTKSAINSSLVLNTEDKKWFIQANYKDINRDAFMSGFTPSQNMDIYNYRGVHFILDVKYKPTSNWEFMAGVQRTQFENVVQAPNAPSLVYGGEIKTRDIYVEANHNLERGRHSLLTGIKVEREGQYDATAYIWNGTNPWEVSRDPSKIMAPNKERTISSLYSEDTIKLNDRTTLVAGFRYDHHEGYGDKTFDLINPRLAAAFGLNETSTVKVSYASASRAPSIYERLGANLPPLVGNPDVKAETVHTLEASYIYKTSKFKGQVTPFYQIFKDKIEFVGDSVTQTAKNNDDAVVMGLELDGNYYFGQSYVFANFSIFDSHDKASGGRTRFLPQVYVNAGVQYELNDKTGINLTAFYRGDREVSELPDNDRFTEAHYNANFSVNHKLSARATVYALVENLSNKQNFIPTSYDPPGSSNGVVIPLRDRTYHVGLKWNL